jgi:hypothetical protein
MGSDPAGLTPLLTHLVHEQPRTSWIGTFASMGVSDALARIFPLTALIAAVALSGCATENHINSVYSIVPPYHLVAHGEKYEIYDRPDLRRLAISPSLKTAIKAHVVDNLPFDLANVRGSQSPGSAYYHPIQQYFLQTGRRCELTNGYILMTPQWEFEYQCHPGRFGPYAAYEPDEPYEPYK